MQVGGEYVQKNLDLLRTGGRVAVIGSLGGVKARPPAALGVSARPRPQPSAPLWFPGSWVLPLSHPKASSRLRSALRLLRLRTATRSERPPL
eukprot:SAG11_NODE_2902_length_2849_cov_1.654909_3_plen_92_part_00